MSTYNELKEEFDNKVKELQKRCEHSDVTNWLNETWAPSHSTGYKVKICNICQKEVDRKPPKDKRKDWGNFPPAPSDEEIKS